MSQKQQLSLAQMKVGVLVTVALVLFLAVILQRSWGIQMFADTVKAVTYLPDVGGLKPGAPVWLAGIEIGRVTEVSIVPPEIYSGNEAVFHRIVEVRRSMSAVVPTDPLASKTLDDLQEELRSLKAQLYFVQVRLEIRSRYIHRIGRDSEVSIESRGLIGDSFIDISPGTFEEPMAKEGEYLVIEGLRRAGIREIMTGANDVVANFGVLSDQVKDIALKINPDKIGTGMTDVMTRLQETLKDATDTFDHATALLHDLRQGPGTVGKLVSDPAIYDRLTTALEKFNKIADQIQDGQGTAAKLIRDPQLYDNAKETLRKAEVMMDRIERGEGTLGKLSKDEQLYERSRQALEKFASLVDQVEGGQGTMGKLLKDPALYNNLNQSTAEITKLIYDLRQDPKKYLTIRFRLF